MQPRSRFLAIVTFSGGWSEDIGGLSEHPSATSLGLSYGYRFHRYIEAEVGLSTALDPTGDVCSHNGCVDIGDHFFWVPFGVRFVTTSANRVEFSGGGGGLYEKYTAANEAPGSGPLGRTAWGGYLAGSVSVAIDHSRHFWLGASPRVYLANGTYARDRWFQIAGEFSFRFR